MRCRALWAVSRVVLGCLSLLVLPPAWADDPVAEYEAIKRVSLKGLESLEVIVPPLNIDAGCRHVSPEELRAEVEARLDDAGIQVGLGTATHLIIAVAAFEPVKDLLCGFSMTVALQQVVLLVPRHAHHDVRGDVGARRPRGRHSRAGRGTPPAHAGPHGG